MALRILFAGTPQAAVPAFEKLADEFEVVAVLTRPDAAQGRGRRLEPSAVKKAAQKRGIPVLDMKPSSPRFFEAVRMYRPDIAAVVAYGRILRQNVLDAVPLGWLNLHFSLLPAWRGAAPVQRAVWSGDTTSGVTVFRLDNGMDTGRVIERESYPITGEPTSGELMAALADFGAGVYARAFHRVEEAWIASGRKPGEKVDALFVPQEPLTDPARAIASKITAEDARADVSLSAPVLSAHIRACDPDPGAWTMLHNGTDAVEAAGSVAAAAADADDAADAADAARADADDTAGTADTGIRLRLDGVCTVPADDPALASWLDSRKTALDILPVGSLIASKKHVWLVPGHAATDGVVELLRVTAPGKRTMRAADWARGARLGAGAYCA